MATVPLAATATEGVKACWLPGGMFVGVWFTLMGLDQVRPPSVDMEKAISSWAKLLKRPSAQTAYKLPLCASAATSRIGSPDRTVAPVFGSVTGMASSAGPGMGSDQVTPWSIEPVIAPTVLSSYGRVCP